MHENGKKIIDALIEDRKDLQGGRIGVFSMSQEKVSWSALSISCPTIGHGWVWFMTELDWGHILIWLTR